MLIIHVVSGRHVYDDQATIHHLSVVPPLCVCLPFLQADRNIYREGTFSGDSGQCRKRSDFLR
jgi:hypothetical protein